MARTLAIIILIVAPTETISIYIFVPINFFAFKEIFPCEILDSAPNASNPFICWSIGRTPKLQPPGKPTSIFPYLLNKEPIR